MFAGRSVVRHPKIGIFIFFQETEDPGRKTAIRQIFHCWLFLGVTFAKNRTNARTHIVDVDVYVCVCDVIERATREEFSNKLFYHDNINTREKLTTSHTRSRVLPRVGFEPTTASLSFEKKTWDSINKNIIQPGRALVGTIFKMSLFSLLSSADRIVTKRTKNLWIWMRNFCKGPGAKIVAKIFPQSSTQIRAHATLVMNGKLVSSFSSDGNVL